MPITARQFGVKTDTSALNLTGYTDHGILLVQNSATAPGFNGGTPTASGVQWNMGPDEERFETIIAYTKAAINDDSEGTLNTEGTHAAAGYEPGDGSSFAYEYNGAGRKISFIGCSNADFLGISQDLVPSENFTSTTQAANYFNNVAESAWTNYVAQGESPTVATTQAPEPTAATTVEGGDPRGDDPTLATTQAPEVTEATTVAEGPGGSYSYYTFTDCNGGTPGVLRYAGSNPNVAPGNAIDVNNQLQPAKWNGDRNGLVGEPVLEAQWNSSLMQWTFSDPIVIGICEG